MKRNIIIGLFAGILLTASFAGQFNIYSDVDLTPKLKIASSGDYDQTMGVGIGGEYSDKLADNIFYVVGGLYQFDREVSTTPTKMKTHFHTVYGQALYEVAKNTLVGVELNYSIPGTDMTGATMTGALGYSLVAQYNMDMIAIKGGYRIIKGKTTFAGNDYDTDSSGLFVQAGYLF